MYCSLRCGAKGGVGEDSLALRVRCHGVGSFHAYPVDAHDLASFSNASRKANGVAEASFFPSVGLFRSLPRWSRKPHW
jgi:hypothetical protein